MKRGYAELGRYYDYFLAIVHAPGEAGPTLAGATTEQVRLVTHSGRFAVYQNLGNTAPP